MSSRPEAGEKLQKAMKAHQAGELQRAERLYRRHLAGSPGDFYALQLLGTLFLSQGRLGPAHEALKSSIQIDPMQPHTQANLGECLRRLGQPAEALFHLTEAVRQSPDNPNAWRSGALAAFQAEDLSQADFFVRQGLQKNPDDIGLQTLFGQLLQEEGDYSRSIEVLQQVLQMNPRHIPAIHNLGVSYRLSGQPKRALECYQRVLDAGVENHAVLHNLGNAEADLGNNERAEACFEQVIAMAPDFSLAYENLADIRWRTLHEHPLGAYEERLRAGNVPLPVKLSYGEWLLRLDRTSECRKLLAGEESSPGAVDLLGRCALREHDFSRAVDLHRRASASHPDFLLNLGIALVNAGDIKAAERELQQLLARGPDNQLALAYLGTCWRLLEDERADMLNHQDLLLQQDLPMPNGISREEFGRELALRLGTLHNSSRYPLRQTLRGGTQTQGNLSGLEDPLIDSLMDSFREAIPLYLSSVESKLGEASPFTFKGKFDFAGAWSVQLQDGGFHRDHVHPMGRISSAYYVSLPETLGNRDTKEGWIRFGVPLLEADLGLTETAAVKPEPGKLLLFPSYFWHGTLPFHAAKERLTVAFDVVPAGSRQMHGHT